MGIFDKLFGKKDNSKDSDLHSKKETDVNSDSNDKEEKNENEKNTTSKSEKEVKKTKEKTTPKPNKNDLETYDGGYTYYYNEKLFTGTSIDDDFDDDEDIGWVEENWVEGISHGEKKEFDKDGQLICLEINERVHNTKYSTIISSKTYSKNGNLIEDFFIGDQYLELKRWYENGEKKETKNYNKENRVLFSIHGRLDYDFTIVQHKKWNEKGELVQDIDHSKSKMTDEEVEKILLLIDSSLSKNPLYEIVKKRGEIILTTSTNIHRDTKVIIDEWSDGHYEEYKVRDESEEDSISKYKNYLEIYNTINKHIQSNYIDKDDSKKLKELVCLRISSYSSLDGVRKYMGSIRVWKVGGHDIIKDFPWIT